MTLVYLIYDYGEHGPENTQATLDPSLIPDIIRGTFKASTGAGDEWIEKAVAGFVALTTRDPDVLRRPGSHSITGIGWGGAELEILELWTAPVNGTPKEPRP